MAKLNEEKFVDVLLTLGMMLPETVSVKVETQDSGEVIASAGPHGFKIRPDSWEKFCNEVNNLKADKLADMMDSSFSGLKYILMEIPETELNVIIPNAVENLTKLPDDVVDAITQRVSNIVAIAGVNIRKIAHLVNKRIISVASDTEIVKDFDAILSFDFEPDESKPFELRTCFDKIPPTYTEFTVVEIHRTPMSQEDKKLYLGDDSVIIDQALKEICDAVNNLYQSKLITFSKLADDYAKALIKGAVIVPFMDSTPRFISFGGQDNWGLFGKTGPNATACHILLDAEIEYLVNYLKEYQVPEGTELFGEPEFFSIDLQHMGIYARNKENKVLSGNLSEAADHLQARWSDGFSELLKVRLAYSDSQYCFYL